LKIYEHKKDNDCVEVLWNTSDIKDSINHKEPTITPIIQKPNLGAKKLGISDIN
jgi:hypothetical protein